MVAAQVGIGAASSASSSTSTNTGGAGTEATATSTTAVADISSGGPRVAQEMGETSSDSDEDDEN